MCGVFVFLHIPKTAGSTITQHLQQNARGYLHGGWNHTTISGSNRWVDVLRTIVHENRRPKLVVIHHVQATQALSAPYIQGAILQPLRCHLLEKGCKLVQATVLRDASARAISAAYYNRVPKSEFVTWVGDHATNGMIAFLLANRMTLRRGDTTPMTARTHLGRSGELRASTTNEAEGGPVPQTARPRLQRGQQVFKGHRRANGRDEDDSRAVAAGR